jgi:sec-independent protein translocase protein TatB
MPGRHVAGSLLSMGGLDPGKVLIILLVAVIVLGPERLPKAARQLGVAWRELTRLRERLESEVRSAMPDIDLPKIPVIPQRGLTGYLAGMMTSSAAGSTTAAGVAETTTDDGVDLLAPSTRTRARRATENGSAGSAFPSSQWQGTGHEAVAEHSELPAGWQAIGAPGPGYASGSNLSPVPSSAASGQLGMEASISFDEPSWN